MQHLWVKSDSMQHRQPSWCADFEAMVYTTIKPRNSLIYFVTVLDFPRCIARPQIIPQQLPLCPVLLLLCPEKKIYIFLIEVPFTGGKSSNWVYLVLQRRSPYNWDLPSSIHREDFFRTQWFRSKSIEQILQSNECFSIHQPTCYGCYVRPISAI